MGQHVAAEQGAGAGGHVPLVLRPPRRYERDSGFCVQDTKIVYGRKAKGPGGLELGSEQGQLGV